MEAGQLHGRRGRGLGLTLKTEKSEEETMNSFLHFHVTVRGARHIRKGTACQDCSRSSAFGLSAVAAAADGHGDIRYFRSGTGAKFASAAAVKAIREFVLREGESAFPKDTEEKICQLKKNIILNWNRKVAAHLADHPFTAEELAPLSETRRTNLLGGKYTESAYGTTLLAAAVTPAYWFGLQIGDGDGLALYDGGQAVSLPREAGLVGNITTSLCEADAFYHFHHVFRAGTPHAVLLSTDGVKNSFNTGENYRNFMDKVALEFSAGSQSETEDSLRDFLAEMTEKGSGDDLSIAGVVRP